MRRRVVVDDVSDCGVAQGDTILFFSAPPPPGSNLYRVNPQYPRPIVKESEPEPDWEDEDEDWSSSGDDQTLSERYAVVLRQQKAAGSINLPKRSAGTSLASIPKPPSKKRTTVRKRAASSQCPGEGTQQVVEVLDGMYAPLVE